MRDIGKLLVRYKAVSSLFGLFIVVYLAQIFLLPDNAAYLHKFHLTYLQYHETLLAVAIPYIVIWVIALVGHLRLRSYAEVLGDSKDGRAFQHISRGMLWFTLWLPLTMLISTFSEFAYSENFDFTAYIIRMERYANIILVVPAFLYVYQGSVELLKVPKRKLIATTFKSALLFITFAALYTALVFHDSARQVPLDAVTPATYYLPDWLVTVTIIIPRLILWYLGVVAVQNITLYRLKVSGVLYRRALKNLAIGLGGVVISIIILRCVQSLSNLMSKASLAVMLLSVYILLVFLAISYIYIAKGAKQLQSIEEA